MPAQIPSKESDIQNEHDFFTRMEPSSMIHQLRQAHTLLYSSPPNISPSRGTLVAGNGQIYYRPAPVTPVTQKYRNQSVNYGTPNQYDQAFIDSTNLPLPPPPPLNDILPRGKSLHGLAYCRE